MCKKILHRCNTVQQVLDACTKYDGAEIDVRHVDGHLTLRHGPHDQTWDRLTQLLNALQDLRGKFTLFVNVKQFDLAEPLAALFVGKDVNFDYFIFDVPGPELPKYEEMGLRVLGRFSECESQQTQFGYLIDAFEEDQESLVRHILPAQCSALISHACHGRLRKANYVEGVDFLIGKADELEDV
jgi:hypothetical protein